MAVGLGTNSRHRGSSLGIRKAGVAGRCGLDRVRDRLVIGNKGFTEIVLELLEKTGLGKVKE